MNQRYSMSGEETIKTGETEMKRLERKWINQPSTLQRYHDLHGKRVIYNPNTEEVWFTDGDIISHQIHPAALSDGWPENIDA